MAKLVVLQTRVSPDTAAKIRAAAVAAGVPEAEIIRNWIEGVACRIDLESFDATLDAAIADERLRRQQRLDEILATFAGRDGQAVS